MTRTSRTHPTTSWHWSRLGMGLLCAQKFLAKSGIIADRKRAHRCCTGQPLPAYSRRLVSPQAMHTGCTCPAGSSRLVSGKPPPVARACLVIVRSHRDYSPEWLQLAACRNYPGASCISDHHRNKPSLEAAPSSGHQAHMLLRDDRGCDDVSAARCSCSRALAGRLRSEGKQRPAHLKTWCRRHT